MVKVKAVLTIIVAATLAGSASAASASKIAPTQAAGTISVLTHRTADVSRVTPPSVRDMFLLGMRVSFGLWNVELPTTGDEFGLDGMENGPDTVDPLGVKGGAREEAPPPVTSVTRR